MGQGCHNAREEEREGSPKPENFYLLYTQRSYFHSSPSLCPCAGSGSALALLLSLWIIFLFFLFLGWWWGWLF